jgi:hypothetical protein
MAIGKTAAAVTYVGMQDVALERECPNLKSGGFKFELHASDREVLQYFPKSAEKRV